MIYIVWIVILKDNNVINVKRNQITKTLDIVVINVIKRIMINVFVENINKNNFINVLIVNKNIDY